MKTFRLSSNSAFTMIEMMIIIVLIGVLAALTLPGFMNMIPKLKLKAEARSNLNYLRLARSKAIADNNQYGVYFDVSEGQLILFKDVHDVQLAYFQSGADSVIEGPVLMESNIYYQNSSFMNNCVIFYPNGSASTSGSIDIFDPVSNTLYTVSVLASTGRVKLQ